MEIITLIDCCYSTQPIINTNNKQTASAKQLALIKAPLVQLNSLPYRRRLPGIVVARRC